MKDTSETYVTLAQIQKRISELPLVHKYAKAKKYDEYIKHLRTVIFVKVFKKKQSDE